MTGTDEVPAGPEPVLADIGSRALAQAVDGMIRLAFLPAFTIPVGALVPGAGSHPLAFLVGTIALAGLVYNLGFELLWSGQTPGKRLLGLQVRSGSGEPVGAAATVLRNLLRAVDALPGLYGLGIAVAFLDDEHRRLGDLVADTVVMRTARRTRRAPGESELAVGEPLPAAVEARAPGLLPSAEALALTRDYLDRRQDLDPDARRQVRDLVLDALGARRASSAGPVTPAEERDDERLLERIATSAPGRLPW